MNIIKGILKEELENSFKIKERFLISLNELPQGSLRKKKIEGYEYYYLKYREGPKVKTKYLGKLSKEQLKEYKEIKDQKQKYKNSIKELNQQIKYLQRIINVKSD